MANFLQVSEPEAAALDAQSYTQANDARLKNKSTNALVAQYGPEAADPVLQQQAITANTAQQTQPATIQSANTAAATGQFQLEQAQRQQKQTAAYSAAMALKQATANGQDMGAAYDSVVAPNAQLLGLSPDDSATLRSHLTANPGSLDAMLTALSGPPKPLAGADIQSYRNPDGTISQQWVDERGNSHAVNLPKGAQPISQVVGAMIPEQAVDGSWHYMMHDKNGNLHEVNADGTPVAGIRAQTGQTNAATAQAREGVYANNSVYGAPGAAQAPGGAPAPSGPRSINQAIIGQESGGNPNVRTSVDGGVGIGQLTPSFVKTFARPGEDPRNPADNLAIANRGIDYYMAQYHDPARAAVAYFSGPQNVAPPGSPTPWKANKADGNGTQTSTYVQQVLGRMGGAQPPAGGGQPAAPAAGSLFASLPPKGRQVATSAAQGLVNGSQQLASIDDQINNLDKLVGPLSVGLGSLTAPIPGTPAANLKAALTTLRAQGFNTWLQGLKNSAGQTGIGRVLQSEATAAMNSFGALEQSQSEDQFRYHLGIFKTRVHQMQSNAEQAFKTQYGADPYSALGVANPSAGGGAPTAATAALRAKYGL